VVLIAVNIIAMDEPFFYLHRDAGACMGDALLALKAGRAYD